MTVEVHLVTPEQEVWTGDVQMLVAHGTDGMVGILGGHAPLLVQLSIAPLRMQLEDDTWLVAVVDGGFLHVSSDEGVTRADVLAANAELADQIDVAAARARLEEAQARAADDELAAAEVAKAAARIVVGGEANRRACRSTIERWSGSSSPVARASRDPFGCRAPRIRRSS